MTRPDRSFSAAAPAAALLALAALCLASPAAADWLVTRDGAKVKTTGGWQVKGKLLVFHTASGDLASMRLDEVDLEASHRATEEAKRPPAAAAREPVEKPRAVLVLTDADVERVRPRPEVEVEADDEEEPTGLEVTDFEEIDDPEVDGLVFAGTLRNSGDKMMLSPRVIVTLYERNGDVIATVEAPASAAFLRPSQSAPFRVPFPTVFAYDTTAVETDGDGLSVRPTDEGESEEGEDS